MCEAFFLIQFYRNVLLYMMLHITKDTTNELIVTVTEKVTISNPYYLFRFVNAQTKNEYFCYLTDTSLFTDRYNSFDIVEGSGDDVEFANVGEHLYFIYQKATNVDNTYTAQNELERGLCLVTTTAATTYDYEPTATTNYAYGGE